ncbi:rhodanese-like domain-containing protein [Lacisediminihabitans changchengi]|uniref:Rhodanese-like domain-containing protein n=1 Tax=Lacisediminihabitans changchengi TaxID=2787634 RepID=A0A934SPQ2_9MICO|nr:rhodanese-like domain-containing protein [Lacisediminihabitans changchengi]MBK4346763.1 rhodanese-like domain-containing protein [Lacisediminihabitans changchengi]MBK4348114.1 rhodanese-like domain-containing protein [Lacisediminihabitans changchengi]
MAGIPEISAANAITAVAEGAWLMDVREQDEWDRGHAPGAHLVPTSRLNELLGEVPTDQKVLVVCHSGMRSARVTAALLREDYDVINVEGGMMAWADAGGALETDGEDAPRVD